MPQPEYLDPSAYGSDGGPVGALLIHATPVRWPRPANGRISCSSWPDSPLSLAAGAWHQCEDLTHIRWQDWADTVESGLSELQGRCETVFVGGLSLGSLLTLWLGANHAEIAGLIPWHCHPGSKPANPADARASIPVQIQPPGGDRR